MKHTQLGRAIADGRRRAGIAKQSDLALTLGVTQQTVSRWEAGTSRPRPEQIPLVAKALDLDASDLRLLASDTAEPGGTFVKPLPLGSLAPEEFEQFVRDLYRALNPKAEVRRAGGIGHTQAGLDTRADFPDGRSTVIQCKRESQFGPAKVRAVANQYGGTADEKILALSRVASPQAADEARTLGWKLWDRDDISSLLRTLTNEVQDRLVDTYFRGRRLELLGRNEPGPWQTVDQFFRPFEGKPVFNHDLPQIGREQDLSDVSSKLTAPSTALLILQAPAGMGKSRLLKETILSLNRSEPETLVRFLSPSGAITPTALESLGAGAKVIVVDDAHDRDDINALLEYAADPARQARLLLATRPYALTRIKAEAAAFGINSPQLVELAPLKTETIREICRAALREVGGDESWAPTIVRAAENSPLIATMAARVIANTGAGPELAKNDDALRSTVMGKFAKLLTGSLGETSEQPAVRRTLEIMAVIQPFEPKDPELVDILVRGGGITEQAATIAIKRIVEGGIALQRGTGWRLAPDILADYLIEESCIALGGKLSPFAEAMLELAPNRSVLRNVLVNLGRLDWRRSDGDTTNSAFLERVWHHFDDITSPYDARLAAIKAIAIFQPKQVMDFVARALSRGVSLPDFAEMLRDVVYSGRYQDDALQLLWDLGQNDPRNPDQNAQHPLRILSALGDFDRRKPGQFSRMILDFAVKIAKDDDSWSGDQSPLYLVKPLMSLAGMETRSQGRHLVMSQFYVNYEVVKPLRTGAIDLAIGRLNDRTPHIGHAAAAFLDSAIRGGYGVLGGRPPPEAVEAYEQEFCQTLERVRAAIAQGVLATTLIAIARAIAWRASAEDRPMGPLVQKILSELPTDLSFRVRATLADGFGRILFERRDIETWQADLEAYIAAVVIDLRKTYPDAAHRAQFVDAALADLVAAREEMGSAHVLINALLKYDPELARAILQIPSGGPSRLRKQFGGAALNTIWNTDRTEGRAFAGYAFASGNETIVGEVAAALGYLPDGYEEAEIALIRDLLQFPSADIALRTIHNLAHNRDLDAQVAADLLAGAKLHGKASLADALAMGLSERRGKRSPLLASQAARILAELSVIPELEGYWIDEMLSDFSRHYPLETADFFMRRVEEAGRQETYAIRAANHGPYANRPLAFLASERAQDVIKHVWAWFQNNRDQNHYFQNAAADFFEAMFASNDQAMVEFFSPALVTASESELHLMMRILRRVQHRFVFEQQTFVMACLERCRSVGPELLEAATDTLYAATASGMRSGTRGEPMPRDIEDEARSTRILSSLSRTSAAYQLYDQLRRMAVANIAQSQAEGRALDAAMEEQEEQ